MVEGSTPLAFRCNSCGGSLEFKPGEDALVCPYCGSPQKIAEVKRPEAHVELDFQTAREAFSRLSTEEVRVVPCQSCGGESTFPPNVESADCHFCGTRLVVDGPSIKAMKPQYILPFSVPRDKALDAFSRWISKRWFAPNALKTMASINSPLKGIYYPFWTFDTQTTTWYRGERGDNYTVQVQSKDSEGKTVTRTEVRVRWTPVAGRVERFFDDTLVPATATLPEKLTRNMKEWDLKAMVEPRPEFTSGFTSETYSENLDQGFDRAKAIMEPVIDQDIRRSIGGDHQRIHHRETSWQDITFKYVQLPLWTLTYHFRGKYFQVLVNGQNGTVSGERPWSIAKIVTTVVGGLAFLGGLLWLLDYLDVI